MIFYTLYFIFFLSIPNTDPDHRSNYIKNKRKMSRAPCLIPFDAYKNGFSNVFRYKYFGVRGFFFLTNY